MVWGYTSQYELHDDSPNLPGEVAIPISFGDHHRPGVAVADAMGYAWSRKATPVQVEVTNYRLKLVEPARFGPTVHVTICSGTQLKSSDRNGKSDPYAILSLLGSYHRTLHSPKMTAVKWKTVNPVWNETFVFENITENSTLKIDLHDKDNYSSDDYLGEVVVKNLLKVAKGHHCVLNLKVKDREAADGQGEGSVRLMIRAEKDGGDSKVKYCSIPLLLIDCVSSTLEERSINLVTRTADQILLRFDTVEAADAVFKAIMSLPATIQDVFCFSSAHWASTTYSPPEGFSGRQRTTFCLERELQRWIANLSTRKHNVSSKAKNYSSMFRLDRSINAGYRLCPTYADEVILPGKLRSEELEASAAFRSKKRYPFVAWVNPQNGAVLGRCSQPATGLGVLSGSSAMDHQCLMRFLAPESQGLTICDARPFMSAQANRFHGGGTEYNQAAYGDCRVEFLDIENIHQMRQSFAALRPGVTEDEHAPLAGAIATWLNHLAILLRGACLTASIIESGESVIVHCSDGWDRTAQIVSLVCLLMDGHYRTIKGLTDLILKDWLLPGHKFSERNGLGPRSDQRNLYNDSSPIFPQFLDCVAQLILLYPTYFEFSVKLLSFLMFHSFSGLYPDFLGNCQKERAEELPFYTGQTVWDEIHSDIDRWVNPDFDGQTTSSTISLDVVSLRRLVFFEELYSSCNTLWSCSPSRMTLCPPTASVRLPPTETRSSSLISSLLSRGISASVTSSTSPGSQMARRETEFFTTGRRRDSGDVVPVEWRSNFVFCRQFLDNPPSRGHDANHVERLLRQFLSAFAVQSSRQPTVSVPEVVNHRRGMVVEYVVNLTFLHSETDSTQSETPTTPTAYDTYVKRRFGEFIALQGKLQRLRGFHMVKRLPTTSCIERMRGWVGLRHGPAMEELRRSQVEDWLIAVVSSASEMGSDEYQHFL
eukprot:TRINITY_DN55534_c0_g1_i1.p1 TRINITY_DN55534_c0_g1~~TRINITY_DN55534_c0_g1_i1.p1  ORF type:complete len:935 (-),score=92.57 TRINITY_DN55534_c0_g1_i1:110-2914(-)